MRCRECNTRVDEDDEYCPECGADLPRKKKAKRWKSGRSCPDCGSELGLEDGEICPECGASVLGSSLDDDDELA